MAELSDEQIGERIEQISKLLESSIDIARTMEGPRQTFTLGLTYLIIATSHPRAMKYMLKTGKDVIANTNIMNMLKEEELDKFSFITRIFNEVIETKYLADFRNIPEITHFREEKKIGKDDVLHPIGAILDSLTSCVERCIELKEPALGAIFATLIGLISIQKVDVLRNICEMLTDMIVEKDLMPEIEEKNPNAFTMMQEWSKQMHVVLQPPEEEIDE